jgi:hypothetical protein
VLIFLPDSVAVGEHYKLITYNYDHWNNAVESNSQLITITEHPTPDGTNLMDMFGAPNCVITYDSDGETLDFCSFVNNRLMTAPDLQFYESTLVRREDILYFQNDIYDNLYMQYEYTIIDPLNHVVNYDLTQVGIQDDRYYQGGFFIPLMNVPHGEYTIQRSDPTGQFNTPFYNPVSETIATQNVEQIGGWASVSQNGGGGNSGTRDLCTTKECFFDDIGENCFDIVEEYISLDFTNRPSPRDIDRLIRGQNDYIFVQVEALTKGFNKVGWQCVDPLYCPVVEVARMQFEDDKFAIMLKIDYDAVLYANNG